MTIVPLSFQLTAWIPAWWEGHVGGDELTELVGPEMLSELARLRGSTTAFTAYCPDLGVGVLPGPRDTTEIAVAAGEAVILHGAAGLPSHLLVPSGEDLVAMEAGPCRPSDLHLSQVEREMTEAAVSAEHALRDVADIPTAIPRPASVRPLPPDARGENKALLVRAARLWTALAAVPESQRSPLLAEALRSAARATLAAYACRRETPAVERRFA